MLVAVDARPGDASRSRADGATPSAYVLLHREQVDDEDEGLVRCDDATGAARAVRHRGGDRQLATTPDLHPLDAGIPARDHLTSAELELEGLPAVPRRVELLAVRERDADVMDRDLAALPGLVSFADDDVVDAELEGNVPLGLVDRGSLERSQAQPAATASPVTCAMYPRTSPAGSVYASPSADSTRWM